MVREYYNEQPEICPECSVGQRADEIVERVIERPVELSGDDSLVRSMASVLLLP